MKTPVKVVQSEIDPVPVEVLATSIRSIGQAMKRIEASGLTERALCLLLADSTQMSYSACRMVIRSLEALERTYTVPPKAKR